MLNPESLSDTPVLVDPASKAFQSLLDKLAPTEATVLIVGETGTGKEVVARYLHHHSTRRHQPFLAVNCGALTESLAEAELFGHEKGAFTGAITRKPGLVETAQGGTLFLDEIGDVPLAMQVKLLRLIESSTYRRVGSVETCHANFRLIAATHKPLEKMMETGEFRQDLYYRISAFPIHLPPLRNRVEDIGLLANSFLQRGGAGKRRLTLDPEALARLQQYPWPGNIRELRNALERASLFADDGVIRAVHLPQACAALPPQAVASTPLDSNTLAQVLATFKGTRSELAKHLGISDRTLYRRLKELGLA